MPFKLFYLLILCSFLQQPKMLTGKHSGKYRYGQVFLCIKQFTILLLLISLLSYIRAKLAFA